MSKFCWAFLSCLLVILAGCQSKNDNQKAGSVLPHPGELIDSVAVPIATDQLNHTNFSVVVKADSDVAGGVYAVRAAYGFDVAEGKFVMPKGIGKYRLKLRDGKKPYCFLIGFLLGNDTAFYDYFEVTGMKGAISMKYIKAYSFE